MNNTLNLGIRGHVRIRDIGKSLTLYNNHNAITPDALMVVTRCLTNLDFPKSIDRVIASGDFGSFEKSINATYYDPNLNTITFRAIFADVDFNGIINNLELNCSTLNKNLAIKEGLNIIKDNQSSFQVDWQITIGNC